MCWLENREDSSGFPNDSGVSKWFGIYIVFRFEKTYFSVNKKSWKSLNILTNPDESSRFSNQHNKFNLIFVDWTFLQEINHNFLFPKTSNPRSFGAPDHSVGYQTWSKFDQKVGRCRSILGILANFTSRLVPLRFEGVKNCPKTPRIWRYLEQ